MVNNFIVANYSQTYADRGGREDATLVYSGNEPFSFTSLFQGWSQSISLLESLEPVVTKMTPDEYASFQREITGVPIPQNLAKYISSFGEKLLGGSDV